MNHVQIAGDTAAVFNACFFLLSGLQALVTILGENGYTVGVLTINMYTAAGWINVLLGVINFVLFLPIVFKERRIAAREAMVLQNAVSGLFPFSYPSVRTVRLLSCTLPCFLNTAQWPHVFLIKHKFPALLLSCSWSFGWLFGIQYMRPLYKFQKTP